MTLAKVGLLFSIAPFVLLAQDRGAKSSYQEQISERSPSLVIGNGPYRDAQTPWEQPLASYSCFKPGETITSTKWAPSMGVSSSAERTDKEEYQGYADEQRDPEEFKRIGARLVSERKWAEAAAMFQRDFLTDSSPRSLASYLNYASCKIALKEYDSARIAYRTFISKKADYQSAWLGLARSLLLMSADSLQRARMAYEEWLKLIPETDEAKYKKELAEAHKNIGVAFIVDKKYEEAIAPLKKSLQYSEADDDTHLRLGQANAMLGDKEEAIKEYQKAFKLNPNNKDAKRGLQLLNVTVD
ncbi:MAG: tetratricopeptide repeat protein [Ignavibacteria bacterium]|nr:tetratricopeptide repeat protein [Ignavibacteria bacterium]